MRLLDTHSGQFVDSDPKYKKTVYAILSHTWDPRGEQTFEELRAILAYSSHSSDEPQIHDQSSMSAAYTSCSGEYQSGDPPRGPSDCNGKAPSVGRAIVMGKRLPWAQRYVR